MYRCGIVLRKQGVDTKEAARLEHRLLWSEGLPGMRQVGQGHGPLSTAVSGQKEEPRQALVEEDEKEVAFGKWSSTLAPTVFAS